MNSNYKVNIKDIQDKYTFKIFCAGADTTEIEQEIEALDTRVDTLETNITNKEDKSNKVTTITSSSTDTQYPSAKLLYNQLALKEDVANKTTTLSSSSTDTQYPSAKCVYDSQTLQDATIEENTTNIEELKTYYESIYNALPKVSGTGESLTLNETAESVMKNKLYPQMEQDSTTGKNRLDGANPTNYVSATSTFSNDIIKVSSTATNTLPQARWVFENLQENDVIRYSAIIQNSKGQIVLQTSSDGTNYDLVQGSTKRYSDGITPSTYEYTIPSGIVSARLLLYSSYEVPTGNSESNYKNTIVTINNNNMDYEPYTGGSPSPSPSYPQPIHTISGDNTIKVVGKNLFDENTILTSGGMAKENGYYTGQISILRTYFNDNKNLITFKENTQYTLSYTAYNGTATNTRMRIYYTDGTYSDVPNTTSTTPTDKYLTSTSGKTIDYLSLDYSTSGTFYIKNIQLEEGTTATDFEPYQSQSKQINLGELEYNAIGDYKDEFVKVDGEWFLRKNIGKYTFDGTELWSSSAYGTNSWASATIFPINYDENKLQVMSNIFRGIPASERNTAGDNVIYSGGSNYVMIRNTTLTSIAEVQSATNGNYIFYALATPQTITLPSTLQNQIEDLYNATMSYKGQTNISQVNNDLAFVVEGSALKDMSDNA